MSPGGSVGALLCRAGGQLALCLGDVGSRIVPGGNIQHPYALASNEFLQ